jgi:MFS family permease
MAGVSWRAGAALLHDGAFARLFAARLISAFGSAMTPVALPFAVLDDLRGGSSELSAVVASVALAQIAMQLFAGALADRGSRQRQMIGADLLAAVAQGTIAALVISGHASVPALVALGAASGVAFALHFPAAVGLVPLVVAREQLQAANALLGMAQSTAFALGAAAGGAIAGLAGAGYALALDAATFAVSALLVAGIRTLPQARGAGAGGSLLRDLRDGFREFVAHTWLWTIVVQFAVMLMGWYGAWAVLGPVVAKQSLGGAEVWGAIAAAEGLGLIAGAALALRVHFPRPMLAAVLCCLPSALIPLLLAETAPVLAIAAAAFGAGVGLACFSVLWNTALHTRVAPDALSRVSSYDVLGSIAFVPLGELLAGFGNERIGTAPALWLCAAAIVAPTLAVLCVRDVREMRAEPRPLS